MSDATRSQPTLFRRLRRRDEQGAILILASVGMVIAMVASALAIDIGSLAQDAREDQKVADLAALDAIRGAPADFAILALSSAARNGFPTSAGYSVTAVEGAKVGNACPAVSVPGAGTVCVTVTSPYKNKFPFVSGRSSVTRTAMASNTAFGGFTIGSSLATFDTARSAILDRFMGRILKGSNISAGLVSWSGLAGANVTLEALRAQLVSAGVSAGTVNGLMNSNVTITQLMTATAAALTAQGVAGAAQATILNTLKAQVTSTALTSFKLGDFMTIATGADNTALASSLNVFQLVTAAAQVANGNNFIDVSDVGIVVPDVLSTKVSLQVIEPPKFYFGPVGGSVSTAQISLTVTPKLDMPISVAGLVDARVRNDLPIKITGAGAVGTLAAASCGTPSGITVTVDPSAFSGSASTTLRVFSKVLLVEVPILDIQTTSVVPVTNGGPSDLSFTYPAEFPPPAGTSTSKHAGSQPVGLNGLMTFTPGTTTVLNAIVTPSLLTSIVSTTMTALKPLVGQVDSKVLNPLLQALGLDIGSADVTAVSLQCNTPTLTG